MNRQEQQLYALFRQDWTIPDEVQAGLERSYEQIRQQCRKQEEPMKKTYRHALRLLVIAAVITLITVTAAAIVLHTDFLRSAFGTGIDSYPAEVITEENGNQWISPANERVEVDADAAEQIVGDHVISAEQTLEVCGYTITVDSYLVDDNGIGVLTYTVEHPDGVTGFDPYHSNRDSDIFEPKVTMDGQWIDCYSYLDQDKVTDVSVTVVMYFCPFEPIKQPRQLEFTVPYLLNAGQEDNASEDYQRSDTLLLPIESTAETMTYIDSETSVAVYLSPLGMMSDFEPWKQQNGLDGVRKHPVHQIENENGELEPIETTVEVIPDRIVLHYADGEEYTVKGEDVLNAMVGTISQDSSIQFDVFNRLVTEEVTSIEYAFSYVDWDDVSHDVSVELTP